MTTPKKKDAWTEFGGGAAQKQKETAASVPLEPVKGANRNIFFGEQDQALIREVAALLRAAGDEYPSPSSAIKVALRVAAARPVEEIRAALVDLKASSRRGRKS